MGKPDPEQCPEKSRVAGRRFRHRYRQKLHRQDLPVHELNYRLLLNNMNVAWHYSDIIRGPGGEPVDLRVRDCNELCHNTFGMTREQVVGRPYREIWPKADLFWWETSLEVARTGQPVHFERASQITNDYWDCYMYSPSPGSVGVFFHEIGERMRAKQAIEELNGKLAVRTTELETAVQELSAFTHTVSHDLRAPIRYIGSFTDLLARELNPGISAKGQHYLDIIRRSTGNMSRLIDQLLDLSRSGHAALGRETVCLDDLVATVWADLAPDREGRNIQVEIAPLPQVSGDPILLQVVFSNLLSNAIKYTRSRTEARIQVSCSATAEGHSFCVRDNGIGFDPDHASKLFQLFQRLHSDPGLQGTGIGLVTVQRIIQRHGGQAWAEATLDGGARFYFTLPSHEP
jgi:signal transduction histidine kinase